MSIEATEDIYNTLGQIDGECATCGAPTRRMGWQSDHHRYWLMCTASNKTGEPGARYGVCDLPTEEKARQRLGI